MQGPSPSCKAVKRIRVQGTRGVNRFRLTARSGRKPLRIGLYRVFAEGTSPAKVLGVRIGKNGRMVPVKGGLMPARWCVARSSSPLVAGVGLSSGTPASFAPFAQALVTRGGWPASSGTATEAAKGGVAAAHAARRIGPAKLAVGAITAASGDGALFRWLAIAVVAFLALSVPGVLVAAAWRDLVHRA